MKVDKTKPRLWEWDYLGMQPLLKKIQQFITTLPSHYAMLDVGCGTKPYRRLFTGATSYVGLDIVEGPDVDVVGEAWNLPFADNTFDVLIATQVLEHTRELEKTVQEIQRVVKPGGYIFISAPLTFVEHGVPYDYWRFTEFGFRHLFRNLTIVEITGLNGYVNTICRLINTFWQYLPLPRWVMAPVFMTYNILGLMADGLVRLAMMPFKTQAMVQRAYRNVYMGLPENYAVRLVNSK